MDMNNSKSSGAAVALPPTNEYQIQAIVVLRNAFPSIAFAAITNIFSAEAFNFSQAFHRISAEVAQHNDGDDAGKLIDDIIPHIKGSRKLFDPTLLAEIDAIPELRFSDKEAARTPAPQRSATPLSHYRKQQLSNSSGDEEKEERECLCCCEDYPMSALKQCGNGHLVCSDCIQRYVSEQCDGNGTTVFKCIASTDCDCHYNLAFLDEVLSPSLKRRANELIAMEEIAKASEDGSDDSYWKCPKCSHMGFVDRKYPSIHCPRCNLHYCTSCNDVFQPNHICQMERKNPKHLAAEAMSRACQRSCPHCDQKYMKSDGCNKIKCKCGKLSCYICGAAITGYSHFDEGSCQLWTSTEEMKTIDREKRQDAGRKVLLEQGITDEEEIAAILRSVNEEDDDQSVDTTAAVQRVGAVNRRVRVAARGRGRRERAARVEAANRRNQNRPAVAHEARRRNEAGRRADNPPAFGVPAPPQAQLAQAQMQRGANQIDENFDMMRLNQPANGALGGRHRDVMVDNERDDDWQQRREIRTHLRSAKAHAKEGRAQEMEDDLLRATELAMQLDIFFRTYYEDQAQRVRDSFRVPGANFGVWLGRVKKR